MIYAELLKAAEARPDAEFLVAGGSAYTYADCINRVQMQADQLEELAGRRWLFRLPDSAWLVLLMVAMDAIRGEFSILGRDVAETEIEAISRRLGITDVITDADQSLSGVRVHPIRHLAQPRGAPPAPRRPTGPSDEGTVIVLTTGTTGLPKGARYTWSRHAGAIRVAPGLTGSRWLLTYNLNHFAGLNVFLTVLCNHGTLVIPDSMDIDPLVRCIKTQAVTHISGTPTFWRVFLGLLRERDARDLRLAHITIGGEAVTDDVLERIRALFPEVPVSQIYATTELGVCFTVRDNRKGFPRSYLYRTDLPVRLRIADGELFVRSPHGMLGYVGAAESPQDDWFATGDLVRVEGDRVVFMGRKSEVINVGGQKLHPHEVEEIILSVEGVSAVRVYGTPNPVTGQLVTADVQLLPGHDPDAVTAQIRDRCAARLERHKRPRIIQIVDAIATANRKVVRRVQS